jgi:hypothetical protein
LIKKNIKDDFLNAKENNYILKNNTSISSEKKVKERSKKAYKLSIQVGANFQHFWWINF